MALLINLIGAGHLGTALGALFAKQRPLVKIGALCTTSRVHTEAAIQFIGDGSYCPDISKLPPADITLIATPDDLITKTCTDLSKNPYLKSESIVMHCSGSLTSDALSSVVERGCLIASVHPMRSFANPKLSVEQYPGTYCAIEGDKRALPILKSLFEKIGSITYELDKNKKTSYHIAGVFSSNYLVTLAHQALTCMNNAGVEHELAMRIIINLMKGSISNLEETLSPEHSLTGPIQRGDVLTIKKHMDTLHNEEQKTLYSSLGKATLALTPHKEEQQEIIEKALQ